MLARLPVFETNYPPTCLPISKRAQLIPYPYISSWVMTCVCLVEIINSPCLLCAQWTLPIYPVNPVGRSNYFMDLLDLLRSVFIRSFLLRFLFLCHDLFHSYILLYQFVSSLFFQCLNSPRSGGWFMLAVERQKGLSSSHTNIQLGPFATCWISAKWWYICLWLNPFIWFKHFLFKRRGLGVA